MIKLPTAPIKQLAEQHFHKASRYLQSSGIIISSLHRTSNAVSYPLASAVPLEIALPQHFSRPFAYTSASAFGAFEITTPLPLPTLSFALSHTRLEISFAQAQRRTQKSHTGQ
jgi:hypothetical protein